MVVLFKLSGWEPGTGPPSGLSDLCVGRVATHGSDQPVLFLEGEIPAGMQLAPGARGAQPVADPGALLADHQAVLALGQAVDAERLQALGADAYRGQMRVVGARHEHRGLVCGLGVGRLRSRPPGVVYALYTVRRTQIYLDERQLARLKTSARAARRSVSEIIREAIDDQLARPGEPDEFEGALAAAVGLWANRTDLDTTDDYVCRIRRDRRGAKAP